MGTMPLTLGGREFAMSPLTDDDISELDNWTKTRLFELARLSLRIMPATEAEQRLILEVALKAGMGLTFLSGEGARLMGTLDGLARLVWQCVKTSHPDVTPEMLRKLLMNNADAMAAKTLFDEMNKPFVPKKGSQPESQSQETNSAASSPPGTDGPSPKSEE